MSSDKTVSGPLPATMWRDREQSVLSGSGEPAGDIKGDNNTGGAAEERLCHITCASWDLSAPSRPWICRHSWLFLQADSWI